MGSAVCAQPARLGQSGGISSGGLLWARAAYIYGMPDLLTLLFVEPVITVAYVVFGMAGFGSTLIAAPLLAHVLPVTTIVPSMALTDFIASWSNGWRLSSHVVRSELLRLVPALFIGSALGAYILFALPMKQLMMLLGIFVMLYALNGFRQSKIPKAHLSARWAWWYGMAGGTLSALFGAGGWVYSMYLLRRIEDPQQVRATQTTVLMFSSLIRVGMFAAAGRLLDTDLLLLVLMLLPALALGLYVGHRISLRMDRRRFMQVIFSVLLLTGSSLVIRSLL
jgi:uncharacterized membrane protein YfcA